MLRHQQITAQNIDCCNGDLNMKYNYMYIVYQIIEIIVIAIIIVMHITVVFNLITG